MTGHMTGHMTRSTAPPPPPADVLNVRVDQPQYGIDGSQDQHQEEVELHRG